VCRRSRFVTNTNRLAKNVSRHKSMAPRPAPPPRGGRVRRVSLLIDLGGGSVGDHHHVRLLVRRLLSHFSRQRPAPRWCVRFYDSGLSPHAFDAKLRARADERAARHAEEEARERERNASDSRVHSWVDEHTRETAGVGSLRVASGKDAGARLGGASEAVRATRYRDFGACDANAAEAFLKHHDEAFALYHERRSSSHRTHSARRPTDRTQTETRGAETAERVTAANVDDSRGSRKPRDSRRKKPKRVRFRGRVRLVHHPRAADGGDAAGVGLGERRVWRGDARGTGTGTGTGTRSRTT